MKYTVKHTKYYQAGKMYSTDNYNFNHWQSLAVVLLVSAAD